jgi:hypothetical protein
MARFSTPIRVSLSAIVIALAAYLLAVRSRRGREQDRRFAAWLTNPDGADSTPAEHA